MVNRAWIDALVGPFFVRRRERDSEFHRQSMGRKQICDSQILAQLVTDGGLRDFPVSFISYVI